MSVALPESISAQLQRCAVAAESLRTSSVQQRDAVLKGTAAALRRDKEAVLAANRADLAALAPDATAAFRDRLQLNEERLEQAVQSLLQVAALPDPLVASGESVTLANGLLLRRVPAPLGVILMIFESRPNVAMEAFSLAVKSGNALILRGGKESMRTTAVLYGILVEAALAQGLPPDVLWGITDPSRDLVQSLLRQPQWIDVVVPRGGAGLINFVVQQSLIPIIKNDRGLCHVYIHDDADLDMAIRLVINAKTQRPGVCNAMETLLVHEKIAATFLPLLYDRIATALSARQPPELLDWFGCDETRRILGDRPHVEAATAAAWDTEYLDLKMNCAVVPSLEVALQHIRTHGSHHSEAIVTSSEPCARQSQARVDAAAVYWNASTRFTDGFAMGLGGELGISTQKLHVRGPVGLRELTSLRWLIDGTGQTR